MKAAANTIGSADLRGLTEVVQKTDVRQRLDALKMRDSVSDDLWPLLLLILAVALAGTLLAIMQRRRRLQRDAAARRRLRDEQERRRRRLAQNPQAPETLPARRTDGASVEELPLADLGKTATDALCAVMSREGGFPPVGMRCRRTGPGGLLLVPDADEQGLPPEGAAWLARRGPRGSLDVFPVTTARPGADAERDGMIAQAAGEASGHRFAGSGRTPTDILGTIIALHDADRDVTSPLEREAVTVNVHELGIRTAAVQGPVELSRGARVLLRLAMPEQPDSIEFPARVRSVLRNDAGQDLLELTLEPDRITATAALARHLLGALPDRVPAPS